MLLFYVWTDVQLINTVNIKCNFFQAEAADLLIWKLERVSDKLIESIKEENIFDNVYILEPPTFYLKRKHSGLLGD